MKQILPSIPLVISVLLLAPMHGTSQNVLFSDDFNTDTSANWEVFEGSASGTPDYAVFFNFDYSTNSFTRNGVAETIPPAPNGGGNGVKMWVNNNDEVADNAAVSIYPRNQTFSGEYALKFDMFMGYNGPAGGGSGSTEFSTFGINHVGDKVNWEQALASDGVWFAVTGESGAAQDYRAYVGDGFNPSLRLRGFDAGFLDRDGNGVAEEEVIGTEASDFPFFLIFPAPEYETQGMPGKNWVEVEIRQRTNELGQHTVTWLMNGYVIAQHSQGDLVGMTAGNVMVGLMDIFPSIANPREDNFVIYDNVRVVDLSATEPLPVVTITATDSAAAEPADPGMFTITRAGDTTGELTVGLRVSGTAASGQDYATLPESVVFASGQTETNISVVPIDDAIGEPVETVVLVLAGSSSYDLYTNFAATVFITDDGDVPTATLITEKAYAYEGNPTGGGRFRVALANPSFSPTTVNFQTSGTAVAGTDYSSVGTSITIPAGETNAFIRILPIDNNRSDPARTATLTLSAGNGYVLGTEISGTVTIRDDDVFTLGDLLYSEDFETDQTGNWNINEPPGDYPVDLFFDYSTVGIPPAPNSTGNSTRGAKLQANLVSGVFGGVSISPADVTLPQDYLLRFDLWQSFNGPLPGGGSGSTQITGAGVGTSGTIPQWPGGTQDSIWFATTGDGGSGVDYRAYSSVAASGYTDTSGVFAAGTTDGPRNNSHPYYAEFGADSPPDAQVALFPDQAGATLVGAQAFAWRDVVIEKRGTNVSWWIDGKLLATVDSTDATLGGNNFALLHSDINGGSSTDFNASAIAFGLFDNVRVYAIGQEASRPTITRIILLDNGTIVELEFSGATEDSASDFQVHASVLASGPYSAVNSTVSQVSPGVFRAVLPANGAQQFYKIQR